MPDADPFTIAYPTAEQFELETADRKAMLERLDTQVQELVVMRAFFDVESKEVATVIKNRADQEDRDPNSPIPQYFNEPKDPMFMHGNVRRYTSYDFPVYKPSSWDDPTPRMTGKQTKLCIVFGSTTLYIPSQREEQLLGAAYEVHVPVLSITSIKRQLRHDAA